MEFRKLKANEIDARVGSISKTGTGLSLLLYKDARVDQNILDETVGSKNWKRSHQLIGDRLYCTVSLYDADKGEWVDKQDVGTESNTEKEKGQASDSFKRACFNWGIGRELYTSPFIWITSSDCTIKDGKCFDKFSVTEIGYDENGNINSLKIKNDKTNRLVYQMGKPLPVQDLSAELATALEKKTFMDVCKKLEVDYKGILKQIGMKSGDKMTVEQHGRAMIILKEIEESKGE